MKINFLILISILFFLSCKSNKIVDPIVENSKRTNQKINLKDQFEILKIDSIQNVYLIYIKRNDSVFKVASDKEINIKCKSIQKGEFYNLKIKSVFSSNFHQKLDIAGFRFSGTLIKLKEEGVIWDLFVSNNFKGICFKNN